MPILPALLMGYMMGRLTRTNLTRHEQDRITDSIAGRNERPMRSGESAQVVCVERFRASGAEEDRTPDLGIANAALSQLSYRPELGPPVADDLAKRRILVQRLPFRNACPHSPTAPGPSCACRLPAVSRAPVLR